MFAITGITGQVGGAVARALLNEGLPVRAVLRDPGRAADWAARGCGMALADMNDAASLAAAFSGCEGVFILLPPNFDPSPGFPESRAIIAALRAALDAARPARVVVISTVGAQARNENLLAQLGLLEQALADLPLPIAFLRPAWFLENIRWDIDGARASGELPSFLQPLDRRIPMVATEDVGRTAAGLLQSTWSGHRVVELEGPAPVSPHDIAASLSLRLMKPVQAVAVPPPGWEGIFRSQGMRHPQARMQMLDGFNAGWLSFEGRPQQGCVGIDEVLAQLIPKDPPALAGFAAHAP